VKAEVFIDHIWTTKNGRFVLFSAGWSTLESEAMIDR
jgi:hypothetical protein